MLYDTPPWVVVILYYALCAGPRCSSREWGTRGQPDPRRDDKNTAQMNKRHNQNQKHFTVTVFSFLILGGVRPLTVHRSGQPL